jgi:hypothetical protein
MPPAKKTRKASARSKQTARRKVSRAAAAQLSWSTLTRRQREQLIIGMDEGAAYLDRRTTSALKELAWSVVESFNHASPDEPLGKVTPEQHTEIAAGLFAAYQVYAKQGMDQALE